MNDDDDAQDPALPDDTTTVDDPPPRAGRDDRAPAAASASAAPSTEGDRPSHRGAAPAPAGPARRKRTSPRQFLREVRGELKRVAWPSRREVASYSLIVLVVVTLVGLFIFGLDTLFGRFIFTIFQ